MPEELVSIGIGFIDFIVNSTLLLAPMLLLGLFLAGVLHVFIARNLIQRWFKKEGFGAIAASAAVGVPIPLCSCSVVPVVSEMKQKGASKSACMSFLITAPETGADSILVTNAFFGWIPALARPIISYVTAVIAGLSFLGLTRKERSEGDSVEAEVTPVTIKDCASEDNCDDCCDDHQPLMQGQEDCYVSPSILKRITFDKWLGRTSGQTSEEALQDVKVAGSEEDTNQSSEVKLSDVIKHVFKYGFVEVGDDIFFALCVGIGLGALLFMVLPSDLMANEYARWASYPIMFLISVPIYICASASTPIAAALVAKGFSPGAALIFLMAGPATNMGTVAMIVSQFGSKFASIYVAGVAIVTVVLGIAIDVFLLYAGLGITVNLLPTDSHSIQIIQIVSAVVLIALMGWRFRAGAFRQGYKDFVQHIRPQNLLIRGR